MALVWGLTEDVTGVPQTVLVRELAGRTELVQSHRGVTMRFAKLAIAVLSFAYAAFGQTGGTITGAISDPAGSVVANAPVEAKNTATGVVVPGATSATGNYTLNELPAGTYEINVAVPGFKKYVLTGVTVQQLQITRVDVTLVIGSATEAVTVNDDRAAPDKRKPEI